jgi:filamentous hemagglutinin family protein
MKARGHNGSNFTTFKLAPVTRAIALLAMAGGAIGNANAVQPFSPAWFANKGAIQATAAATGLLPNGKPVSSLSPQGQQQAANNQLQKSIADLTMAAHGIAWQQSMQALQRQKLLGEAFNGVNGLGIGGLDNSVATSWTNANAPTQTTDANGNIVVDIQQTADKAIANWNTFNVGRNTIVQFDQASADWAILNRITDPSMSPSHIEGQIRAPGTVLIVNQNGIVFSGTSQVNVRNLVAAAAEITDSQFTNNGIYGTQTAGVYASSFTDAGGQLKVEQGAQINTSAPTSATQGGGYVLLMGQQVSNSGDIETPKGQIEMAAGDNFVIRKGIGTDANQSSTTRGNEISPSINAGSTAGQVVNTETGLLIAREGDITLAGHDVQQNGVAIATTTVNNRGTIHLLNSASDATGLVTLGATAITAVAIEDDGSTTALDSQRDAEIASSAVQDLARPGSAVGQFDNLSRLTDREDQGRIEIVSGGDVDFAGGSLSLATGGQIAVSAAHRTFVVDGAILDVAGQVGVNLAMSSNNVVVNVQGNELRDSPANRDSGDLFNSNITIDRRDLIEVPAEAGVDDADRWYTANGLLEVSGYLNNQGHTIGEWAAQGGTIQLGGNEVITQTGSQINLSGGSLNVATGYVAQTWLVGSDGQLYNANNAPAGMTFSGVYKGFEVAHTRWGTDAAEFFYNPLIAPQKRLENGYTVGRDAGQLIINAPTAVIEGDILAQVFTGAQQVRARDDVDGYDQAQTAVAKAGSLSFGQYNAGGGILNGANATDITVGDIADITGGMGEGDALSADRANTTWLDAGRLNAQGFGEIDLNSSASVKIDAPLTLLDGGILTAIAPQVDVDADITAHGGSITLGNLFHLPMQGTAGDHWVQLPAAAGEAPQVTIETGSVLDLTGVWINAVTDPDHLTTGLPYIDGGSLTVSTTGGITLAAGSLVDVSSGGALLAGGKLQGGNGGDVSLITNNYTGFVGAVWDNADRTHPLIFDGAVRSIGFNGGGTLTLSAPQTIVIGAGGPGLTAGVTGPELDLATSLFQSGFTKYDITGSDGMQIADGATVAPVVPVYRLNDAAMTAPTGSNMAGIADVWTPPVFIENIAQGKLTQRAGADLTLATTLGDFLLPQNASITVDPGHAVDLYVNGQTTVQGDITARGGSIVIGSAEEEVGALRLLNGNGGFSLTRSFWIGENAVLDVSGLAQIDIDAQGRNYGVVSNGGSIELGGSDGAASDAFIVIRPGALLEASGATGALDIASGNNTVNRVQSSSDGGLIALNSNDGIYIDGDLRAVAGGAGASGGTLSLNMVSHRYSATVATATNPLGLGPIPVQIQQLRNITISQNADASALDANLAPGAADPALLFGQADLGVNQIQAGGFDSLALKTSDLFVFKGDVNLSMGRSLSLGGGLITVADSTPNINVALAAPYVRIDGFTEDKAGDAFYNPGINGVLPSTKVNDSVFSVDADLLDIYGGLRFGASGREGSGFSRWVSISDNTLATGNAVDAAGFAQVNLTSSGDIRLGNGALTTDPASVAAGWIKTDGDLTLTAAQIYPLSGASVTLYAGLRAFPNGSEQFDAARPQTIVVRSNGDDANDPNTLPPVPPSAFGDLTFEAATIDQGGVVRAPLGVITLVGPTSVIFRDGSLTSTSANGLTMPFGGTKDGITYTGTDGSTLFDLGSVLGPVDHTGSGTLGVVSGISVTATSVVGEAGAVLDMSGGGNLTGAGFITGRGGSVDVLNTPLINANPANTFSAAGNQIYAIMPGYSSAYAPVIATNGKGDPAIGQQVTIPAGVPDLPAGTYTLLPSSYALLPGAFRVEIGASGTTASAPVALPGTGGSYIASGTLGVANTGIHDALPTQLILSSGAAVRDSSQYNETSYADFERSQAALFGNVRPRLPEDGQILEFALGASAGPGSAKSLSFAGTALFNGVDDGIDGSLIIMSQNTSSTIDITAPGAAPVAGHTSISSDDINAFKPATLFIGGAYFYYQDESIGTGSRLVLGGGSTVNLLDGSLLRAGQVFVVGPTVNVAGSATIDTIGQSEKGLDSSFGYVYSNVESEQNSVGGSAILAVANGFLNFLPLTGTGTLNIASGASLLTEGSIVLAAPGALNMGDVNFGARYLTVSQNQINAGDAAALAAAQAANVLPAGWNLNQETLDKLLHPSTTEGAPALERLILTAGGAINFFGDVALDARSQSGDGQDVEFVLNTPAIYGAGNAGNTASIAADDFIWNGVRTGSGTTASPYGSKAPAAVLASGAGTGSGLLSIDANTITFGYDSTSRPTDGATLDRLALGFADVNLNASAKITANSDGTLSVGQSKDGSGNLVGGNLTVTSPLVTAEAGSTLDYKAGGAIRVVAPAGIAPTDTAAVTDQGGTLSFTGDSVFVDTAFALPSGKLTLTATNDIQIGGNAGIDLAGRTISFLDVNKYGWGGDLVMQSAHGDITQDAGSLIDVSATFNQAGSIAAVADEGNIALNGTLRGSANADSQSGSIGLRGQSLGDFAALNTMLNNTGFFGSRAFVLRQGDLTVGSDNGSEVRANTVSISVDNGSLTINGTIDASGDAPGSIRLASMGDLTLGADTLLDTHGNLLQTDSNNAPIDANNTAHIDLTTSQGTVVLTPGATIDMRAPDNVLRGDLEINAPRLGSGSASATGAGAPTNATGNDIAISAAGPLNIRGADTIAVNGFATYTNAPADPADANGQIIDQAWLDLIHQDSTAFYDSALANGDLQNRLAGLTFYGSAFHMRPGVEIASATPDGDLTVQGDLDFSNYRYGPGADTVNHTGIGEVGIISFRAGGTLTVNGSINDGFAPPPVSPDALTTLLQGPVFDPYTVTTAGVNLAGGWLVGVFDDAGPAVTISVALPLGTGFFFVWEPTINHPLPINIPLAQDFTIGGFGDQPIGGDIFASDGHVLYNATDIVPPGTLIPAGSVLGAGMHDFTSFQPIFTTLTQWPANTDLSVLAGSAIPVSVALPVGTVLPANFSLTDVTLTGPGDRKVWATSAMQAPGAQSWSMQLVGGADLSGADSRALLPASNPAIAAGGGNVVLNDPFTVSLAGPGSVPSEGVSVVRTGTGNLEILAGGSYRQDSPYGVYTAGTAVPETGTAANAPYEIGRSTIDDGSLSGSLLGPENASNDADYEATLGPQRMYYTEHGGDFLLMAQGDIDGNLKAGDSTLIGNWLLRQGGDGQAAAWGINFGSYTASPGTNPATFALANLISLDAFSGMGALGGGNVTLRAGGDIGDAGHGIVAAVGGSGRVQADGATIKQTGGGTLTVVAGGNVGTGGNQFVNLRGDTNVATGNFGSLTTTSYGFNGLADPRPVDPLTGYAMTTAAGGSFAPGDGAISVRARGDLAMGTIDDPGRVALGEYANGGAPGVQTASWFTLWTDHTVVDLTAAGGNVSPFAAAQGPLGSQGSTGILPSVMRVTAASGSIYLTPGQDGASLLMPSPDGELQLLALDSIIENARSDAVGALSTSTASIATPLDPAWVHRQYDAGQYALSDGNTWSPASDLRDQRDQVVYDGSGGILFAFGANTITDASAAASDGIKSSIYAINGDIFNLHYGQIFVDSEGTGSGTVVTDFYRAAKLVDIAAGGDIVDLGGLILHSDPTDISTIAAAGNIIYAGPKVSDGDSLSLAGLQIAGSGTLELTAGKNIYQGSGASIESIGPKVSGDTEQGASVVLLAGVGAGTPGIGQVDWTDFAERYLDPANQAGPGALASQPGKVADTYGDKLTLTGWLSDVYGYTGNDADAPAFLALQQAKLDAARAVDPNAPHRILINDFQQASQLHLVNWLETRYGSATGALHYDDSMNPLAFFDALPAAQQRVLLRDVYYAELTASGREFNNPDSSRFNSYLRGRDAIAALFPAPVADYAGDISMFSSGEPPDVVSASVHTDFGGDIQLLAPGGQVTLGTEGLPPGADAGLITQGAGNIQLYADSNVLLGLSRVMTTFGGDILMWSATGDINAGRGSKTTILFTPPKRTYDDIGDVALAPVVPSSGAGIATLAPIPEVPAGDVDLIAPLGTIDAGEAGIRVSGNVNIDALQVVNAANIEVKGKSTGLPVVATVNVAALTNASAAAAQAAMAAQDVVQRDRASARQALPSIFTVRVLGFGNDPASGSGNAAPGSSPSSSGLQSSGQPYDANSLLQVVSMGGDVNPGQAARLTAEQRRRLQQAR